VGVVGGGVGGGGGGVAPNSDWVLVRLLCFTTGFRGCFILQLGFRGVLCFTTGFLEAGVSRKNAPCNKKTCKKCTTPLNLLKKKVAPPPVSPYLKQTREPEISH